MKATPVAALAVLYLLFVEGNIHVTMRIIKRKVGSQVKKPHTMVVGVVQLMKWTTNPMLITIRTLAADTGKITALPNNLLIRRFMKKIGFLV